MSDDTTTVAQLRTLVADFVAQREWNEFHDPKNLSMAIAIEAAELMEHFQWLPSNESATNSLDDAVRSEVVDELADVTCFVLALANRMEIDLSDAVARKMKKNAAKYPADEFRGKYFKPASQD